MSNRDPHRGSRQDKRRAQLNRLAAEEQREQEKFHEMDMMRRPAADTSHYPGSQARADYAALAARVTVIEAELAEGVAPRPAKGFAFLPWLLAALVAGALIMLAVEKLF